MVSITDASYSFPISKDSITRIVTNNSSHQGAYENSVDFACELGTPVLAAAEGVVTRARDDNDQYGEDPKYGQLVNYITIKHAHNELSEYLHLAKDSALVKVGDRVKPGQHIATTGLSGWMTAPHLHFMVYKQVSESEDFQCLKINFEE